MTRLDEIRETRKHLEHLQSKLGKEWWRHVTGHAPVLLYEDVCYLLALLQSRPASEPPDDDRLVIVRWNQGSVSLGQYTLDGWCVRGWVIVRGVRCPVETWQELPPVRSDETAS